MNCIRRPPTLQEKAGRLLRLRLHPRCFSPGFEKRLAKYFWILGKSLKIRKMLFRNCFKPLIKLTLTIVLSRIRRCHVLASVLNLGLNPSPKGEVWLQWTSWMILRLNVIVWFSTRGLLAPPQKVKAWLLWLLLVSSSLVSHDLYHWASHGPIDFDLKLRFRSFRKHSQSSIWGRPRFRFSFFASWTLEISAIFSVILRLSRNPIKRRRRDLSDRKLS